MHGSDRSTADVKAPREAEGDPQIGDVLSSDNYSSAGSVEARRVVDPDTGGVLAEDVHPDAVDSGRRYLEVPRRRVVTQRRPARCRYHEFYVSPPTT